MAYLKKLLAGFEILTHIQRNKNNTIEMSTKINNNNFSKKYSKLKYRNNNKI
jgi:hypothetical protein